MVETIKFRGEHLLGIQEHVFSMSESATERLTPAQLTAVESRRHSYTVVEGERVLACCGVTESWPGRAEAWAILDRDLKQDFIKVHNQVKNFLESVDVDRVEAIVEADFKEGLRWVESLGFKKEALMRKFSKSGQDSVLFSRVRD